MANLLYENISPRNDNGILVWNEGETFTVPITLEIEDFEGNEYNISEKDTLLLTIKKDRRNVECLYTRTYTNIKENMILFTVDDKLTKILRRGSYILRATLNSGNQNYVVINNLPLKVIS